jgi:hypothetical protein
MANSKKADLATSLWQDRLFNGYFYVILEKTQKDRTVLIFRTGL